MNDLAVRVENVGKLYQIGKAKIRHDTLRDAISDFGLQIMRCVRLNGKANSETLESDHTIWALKDVSFQVQRGEVVGIIGRNGAGKSTLLKILSRITEPTKGRVIIDGRVGSLLEVGTGFHPELTGRENIYLNGAILGMKKKEIDRQFDEIVAFAEIEKFLDTPVKHYSSGMYIRLGFSVAAHQHPNVLLVDEVLAVGDISFQQRSFAKMRELAQHGTPIILVSHNLGAVQEVCSRVLWLDRGAILGLGPTDQVIKGYLEDSRHLDANSESNSAQAKAPDAQRANLIHLLRVRFKSANDRPSFDFCPGDDLIVELDYCASQPIEHPYFSIGVGNDRQGNLFLGTMLIDGDVPEVIEGNGKAICQFHSIPLMPGRYQVWASIRGSNRIGDLLPWQRIGFFQVQLEGSTLIRMQGRPSTVHLYDDAPIYVPYSWQVSNSPPGFETE